jgi:hypothetical protein
MKNTIITSITTSSSHLKSEKKDFLFKKESNLFNWIIILVAIFGSMTTNAEAPASAEIVGVRLAGSGCDHVSANATISPDFKDLSVLFDNMSVATDQAKVNLRTLTQEVNCNVLIDVAVPPGWSFAFTGADYRGFASAATGTQVYQKLLFSAPGMPIVSMREARFNGGYNAPYFFQAPQKPGRYAYSSCGNGVVTISLNAVVGIYYLNRGAFPQSLITLDTQDMSLAQTAHMDWKRCY